MGVFGRTTTVSRPNKVREAGFGRVIQGVASQNVACCLGRYVHRVASSCPA